MSLESEGGKIVATTAVFQTVSNKEYLYRRSIEGYYAMKTKLEAVSKFDHQTVYTGAKMYVLGRFRTLLLYLTWSKVQ